MSKNNTQPAILAKTRLKTCGTTNNSQSANLDTSNEELADIDAIQSCLDNIPPSNSDGLQQPYVCPVCQKSFRHLNVLKTHSRVHTGEKPYSCTVCHRSFSHKSTLNEHMNLHSENKPYTCDVCQRQFKQRKSLRVHRCETSDAEAFQCEVCGRNFINRKALALHRIHHEPDNKEKEAKEKTFLCDVCARGFTNKYLLKAHLMTHVSPSEKQFECPVCKKKFALKKTLQVHESSHKTDNKGPYQCSYCPKSFRYVANLDAHERVHTGHKPFECNICEAAFRQKSLLKEHMLSHETIPADQHFACDLCDKTFQIRRQYVAHRYSHNKKTKRCPVCKKRFYNAERLTQHLSEHEQLEDNVLIDKDLEPSSLVSADPELVMSSRLVEPSDGALVLRPTLLHVIQTDDVGTQILEGDQDGETEWSFEVVIATDP